MNIENKFLLVCLQLIIVLFLMSVNAEGLSDMRSRRRLLSDETPVPRSSKYLTLSSTSPVARAYRLHNLRAKADVLMDKNNRVSATARNSDERGELGLESVMKDDAVRTRIRGLVSDKYLCFNHRGRLVTKPKGRARGAKCEFIEYLDPNSGSSSFKSVLNPEWRIGFNQRGHGLLGPSYENTECQECFLFHKTTVNNNSPFRRNPHHRSFDPARHNQEIGQIHPGLNPNFLSSFPFPPQSSSSLPPSSQSINKPSSPVDQSTQFITNEWKEIIQKLIYSTTTTTTTPKPQSSTQQPPRHRLRHRKRKHRHQNTKKHHLNNDNPNSTQ